MKIAVFFHARLSGEGMHTDGPRKGPPVIPAFARDQFKEQVLVLLDSGLCDASEELYIGLNGGCKDQDFVKEWSPNATNIFHGEHAKSLLTTMRSLQAWLPGHEDWAVLFFHMKGVTHPADPLMAAWRRCMEHCVIWNWRRCIHDLNEGFESVGAHWLRGHSEGRPVSFWGGVFFWAKASYLLTLPKLPEKDPVCRHEWFTPEHWIGSSELTGTGRLPRVKDYAPHWPSFASCTHTVQNKK